MSKTMHSLRNLTFKLGVSGTTIPIAETRLYKGSYGFVKLQVYAPKTQNTNAPICTAFCTTTDELGRMKISSCNYNLMYVGEFELEGDTYLLFESLLPKEFTQKKTSADGLKLTFNYFDTEVTTNESGDAILGSNGVPRRHATDLLVSSTYTTTVYSGGWNDEDVELKVNSAEVGQIVANMQDIAEIQGNVTDIQSDMQNLKTDNKVIHAELKDEIERAKGVENALDKKMEELSNVENVLAENLSQVNDKVDGALEQVEVAVDTIKSAKEIVNGLEEKINAANETANSTIELAESTQESVEKISRDISDYKVHIDKTVIDLEKQIVQSSGGSSILVDGNVKAQVEFKSDPQIQLDTKADTITLADRTALINILKPYLPEESLNEVENYSTSELIAGVQEILPEMFMSGSINKMAINLLGEDEADEGKTLALISLIGGREDDKYNLLMSITDLLNRQITVSGIMQDGTEDTDLQNGRIKIIGDEAFNKADPSTGWTYGSANVKYPQKGLYLTEIGLSSGTNSTIYFYGGELCSLCIYYGRGYTGSATEQYTPIVTQMMINSQKVNNCIVYPHRLSNTLMLRIMTPSGEWLDAEAEYMRYYQIM